MSSLQWEHEVRPVWDEAKARIAASAPKGALDLPFADGAELPGDWFLARDGDQVVGFGALDTTWGGDAQIALAVDAARNGTGVGSWVMDRLEQEARARGINYVHNVVRDEHPQRDEVHDWLAVRGYRGNERDATLRKRVGEAGDGRPAASAGPVHLTADPAAQGDEEGGGYVDVTSHRY